MIACYSNCLPVAVFSICLPCQVSKKRLLPHTDWQKRYTPCAVVPCRYGTFAPHSTLAESISLFTVLISINFTSLSLITRKVLLSALCPALSFIRLIEFLFTAHHGICAPSLLFTAMHGWKLLFARRVNPYLGLTACLRWSYGYTGQA